MAVNERFSLIGKTAVVTGAAGFLGKYFCRGLAEAGANVAVLDIHKDQCDKLAGELIDEYGIAAAGVVCDITNERSVSGMVGQVCEKFSQIDVLINSAAYSTKESEKLFTPFEEYPDDEWKRMIDVNINGAFLCSKHVGASMLKKGRGGSIILISSIYGLLGTDHRIYQSANKVGQKMGNPACYSMTKGALIALAKHLSTYWADKGIRVNVLTPGGTKNKQIKEFVEQYSDRVPMGRMAEPEEMIGALVYLASDASSYVTGQNIIVDGGLSAW
jgi:NAD(P)-dependent dehydrogenase (short-subunit alcohol dehydrogenase family)